MTNITTIKDNTNCNTAHHGLSASGVKLRNISTADTPNIVAKTAPIKIENPIN